MPKELKITLGAKGEAITVDLLIRTLDNTLDMLRTIERSMAQSGDTIHWDVVHARMSSPLTMGFMARGAGRLGTKIVKTCVDGFRQLEKKAVAPKGFDDEALEAAERLAAISEKGPKLKLYVPDEPPAVLTKQTVTHLKEISEKARVYIEYTTIEGRLEEISIRHTDHVNVWETLTNSRIECRVTAEQMEEAWKAIRARVPRVAIAGRLRYRNNRPTLMLVESIRVLRTAAELPQPQDIGPIDITGGVSSEEYIRRLRDGA